jgi:RNA polymerase sigma-70 factor (ECF subfamily)
MERMSALNLACPTASKDPLPDASTATADATSLTFEQIYDECARFVWRALLRLGVAEEWAEDMLQEVFVIVHRRLGAFRGGSQVRTWVYGIAVGVARNHRRSRRRAIRALPEVDGAADLTTVPDRPERSPDVRIENLEAARLVLRLLDELDDELREVFVLIELEGMTAAEVAGIFGSKPNTISSRLRAARIAFEKALRRSRARDEWRLR